MLMTMTMTLPMKKAKKEKYEGYHTFCQTQNLEPKQGARRAGKL